MNSNRLRTQQTFENFFGGITTDSWRSLKKSNIKQYTLSASNAEDLKRSLFLDSEDLYFKGLLSLTEAIINIDKGLYSWATVKLYYSIFYLLRCSLGCKNIAILRHMRELFYVPTSTEQTILIAPQKQDHQAVIELYQKLYKDSDILQSNTIDNINSYEWLKEKREEVNYKDREFHEPHPPEFFTKIEELSNDIGLAHVIDLLVNDEYFLCFQPEYAILGIPIKRLILTHQDLINRGVRLNLNTNKKEKIKNILPFSNDAMIDAVF